MDTKSILEEYGLTEKEAQVYLKLLPLGKINLQEIAKRINLPRTTIYNTLNYLHQKGLVSKVIKEHVTFFEAVNPKKIINDIDEKKKLILSVLPELESIKKEIKESSNVEIYEGFKGISTILSDIFRTKQQTYYFGSYSKSLEILRHLPEHIRTIRLENKIPAKIVIDPYIEDIFHKKTGSLALSILALFSLVTFVADFYKTRTVWYLLSPDQWLTAGGFIICFGMLYRMWKRTPRKDVRLISKLLRSLTRTVKTMKKSRRKKTVSGQSKCCPSRHSAKTPFFSSPKNLLCKTLLKCFFSPLALLWKPCPNAPDDD